MHKQFQPRTELAWDTLLVTDQAERSGPLHLRLTNALRDSIHSGRIPVGSALPASRQLAQDLGCSRWVVTEAYEQLVAEGYLEARVGSATRVREWHDTPIQSTPPRSVAVVAPRFDLRPGLGDLRMFPRVSWMRALREAIDMMPAPDVAYPNSGGNTRLRQVLADYLRRVRGAYVSAENLTITSGIFDGITQLTRAIATAGYHSIGIENPSWNLLRVGFPKNLLRAGFPRTGLEIVPIDVDSSGIRIDQLSRAKVRTVIVAPAHQFPSGAVLAPERRAALLDWARDVDGLVLEDDHDAEFRYDRMPVGALQGVDPERVALFGSLSRTLAPALRLGWAVTPRQWTEAFRRSQIHVTGPSVLEQVALALFIETGAYDRHLRLLRRKYRARRDRLVAALRSELPECPMSGSAAGLHLVVWMPDGLSGAAVLAVAHDRSVSLGDLREFSLDSVGGKRKSGGQHTSQEGEGLVIGYGNLDDSLVEGAVSELARAVRIVRGR